MYVVQPVALVNFVARHPQGVTLQKIATHFSITWQEALASLWSVNMAEGNDGQYVATLNLPLPPQKAPKKDSARVLSTPEKGHIVDCSTTDSYSVVLDYDATIATEYDADAATPDSLVSLVEGGDLDIPFMLDEAIALTTVLDELLAITPHGEESDSLRATRRAIEKAVAHAGFPGTLPEEKETIVDSHTAQETARALHEGRYITFEYYKPGLHAHAITATYTIIPLSIHAGESILCIGDDNGTIKRFRLDRMANVELGDKVNRLHMSAARRRHNAADSLNDSITFLQRNSADVPENSQKIDASHATDASENNCASNNLDEGTHQQAVCRNVFAYGQMVTVTVGPTSRWIAERLPGANTYTNGDICTVTFPARSIEWLTTILIQLDDLRSVEPESVACAVSRHIAPLMKGQDVTPHHA
ncbi:WYL domain-containing protein [Actinotignum urinale]|uniref:WYL domain-containing protein n=1 Tax=Actinotignum urinale TaxID=190146 RepID=UPI0003B4277E|nr:WYL domain-containing protein [Actinotignum urinale]MDY5160271.1 WYL domain-containing protein [Actinotignum urinale]